MITSITFILDPPLGRYSSDTCVRLVTRGLHPDAPSMVAPAAPAPATLRKSLRVRVRSFTRRLPACTGEQKWWAKSGQRARRTAVRKTASYRPFTRTFLIAYV